MVNFAYLLWNWTVSFKFWKKLLRLDILKALILLWFFPLVKESDFMGQVKELGSILGVVRVWLNFQIKHRLIWCVLTVVFSSHIKTAICNFPDIAALLPNNELIAVTLSMTYFFIIERVRFSQQGSLTIKHWFLLIVVHHQHWCSQLTSLPNGEKQLIL